MKCRMCSRTNETMCERESTKEGMAGLVRVFIGKIVERMESMLNQNGMSINQRRSLTMNHVKYFGILLY